MTRPQDIPEDVWNAADAAFERGAVIGEVAQVTIARAILAERERCAKHFGHGDLEADAMLFALEKQVGELVAALRGAPCPYPAKGRPDDDEAGACFDAGACGCVYGSALATVPPEMEAKPTDARVPLTAAQMKARKVVKHIHLDPGNIRHAEKIIERVLMLERESCAKLVAAFGSDVDPALADHLADAIRKGGA